MIPAYSTAGIFYYIRCAFSPEGVLSFLYQLFAIPRAVFLGGLFHRQKK